MGQGVHIIHCRYPCFHVSLFSCFRFDIEATVAELEQVLLHPPPPSSQRESVDGCGFSKAVTSGQAKSPASKGIKSGVRGSTGSPAKRKLFKSEGKEQKADRKGMDISKCVNINYGLHYHVAGYSIYVGCYRKSYAHNECIKYSKT